MNEKQAMITAALICVGCLLMAFVFAVIVESSPSKEKDFVNRLYPDKAKVFCYRVKRIASDHPPVKSCLLHKSTPKVIAQTESEGLDVRYLGTRMETVYRIGKES